MENASKALIIAGAILISILLISVGVMIMSSTGDTQQTVEDQSKATAIRSFNSQFLPYENEAQPASQVRALISTVNSSNAATDHEIVLLGKTSGFSSKKRYKIEILYNELNTQKTDVTDKKGDGYITAIRITENT